LSIFCFLYFKVMLLDHRHLNWLCPLVNGTFDYCAISLFVSSNAFIWMTTTSLTWLQFVFTVAVTCIFQRWPQYFPSHSLSLQCDLMLLWQSDGVCVASPETLWIFVTVECSTTDAVWLWSLNKKIQRTSVLFFWMQLLEFSNYTLRKPKLAQMKKLYEKRILGA
jgi:hypothetical protein